MSVINQMLKDLDGRKRLHQSPLDGNLPVNNYVSEQKVSLVKILSLILFIIFLVVLVTSVLIYKFEIFKPELIISEPVTSQPIISEPTISEQVVSKVEPKTNTQKQVVVEQSSQANAIETINNQPTIIEPTIIENPQKPIEQQKSIVKTPPKISARVQAETLYKKARIEEDRGNLSAVKSLLKQSLELNINNHKARILLLGTLLNLTHFEEMQTLLTSSANQWREVHEYRQMQARLYLKQGQQSLALSTLENNIPSVSDSTDYHALLAYIAQKMKKNTLASHHYQLLLQFNNSRADWWLGLAVSEERLGNNSIALKAYNQSISQMGLSESVKNYARQRIKVIQGY